MKWHSVSKLLPKKGEYVLVKTPYCRYPATVSFYNGVEWRSAEDKGVILNVEEWQRIQI